MNVTQETSVRVVNWKMAWWNIAVVDIENHCTILYLTNDSTAFRCGAYVRVASFWLDSTHQRITA